jgi:sirohydrochlorin ferrochelatase
MDQQRFALAWDRPSLPGALTHVSLFDGGNDPLHVVASGHGAGDANALRDLMKTLRERNEGADAIGYVSREYAAVTGKVLARSG